MLHQLHDAHRPGRGHLPRTHTQTGDEYEGQHNASVRASRMKNICCLIPKIKPLSRAVQAVKPRQTHRAGRVGKYRGVYGEIRGSAFCSRLHPAPGRSLFAAAAAAAPLRKALENAANAGSEGATNWELEVGASSR